MNEDLLTDLQAASELAESSLASSTRAAYAYDWIRFVDFCKTRHVEALPAEPSTIAAWIGHRAFHAAPSSIERSLVAIGFEHRRHGLDDPTRAPEVRQVRSGLARASRGRAQHKATPILFDDLRAMMKVCSIAAVGIRDRALLALGWTTGARRSEIVSLNVGDLYSSDDGYTVTFRVTKTGKQRVADIPRLDNGFVDAIDRWLSRYTREPSAPLFISMGKLGRHMWTFGNQRSRLQPRAVRDIVARYARLARLPAGNYTAHSLRRGVITELASRGVPAWAIQRMSGHASIEQLSEYVDSARIFLDSPLRCLELDAAPVKSLPEPPEPSQE